MEENELEETTQVEEETTLEEENDGSCAACDSGDGVHSEDCANHGKTNENWFKGNKDKLMFETLMKKWIK